MLFADLQKDDFGLIHQPIAEMEFTPNEMLYQAGNPAEFVFTIRGGLVKLVKYLPDGTQRIVRLLRQGDLAGIEALSRQPYEHRAIVLEPVSVCRIPVDVIERLNAGSPRLYEQLMSRWQRVIQEADIWLADLCNGPARARVARMLLHLMVYGESDSFYLPSREDLGAMLAITTETASRIIADFKRNGCVQELDNHRAQGETDVLERIAAGLTTQGDI